MDSDSIETYGEEWKKEMMRFKKSEMLDMCAEIIREKDDYGWLLKAKLIARRISLQECPQLQQKPALVEINAPLALEQARLLASLNEVEGLLGETRSTLPIEKIE